MGSAARCGSPSSRPAGDVEDTRLRRPDDEDLERQGLTSFYMQCTGEEAIACAFQTALEKGDMNFPTYRQQGLLIAQEWPVVDMMCQVLSN